MESDLWRGFLEVADTGSFTEAADRLPISQSGLSQQLRRLERQLGVELLARTNRPVELTEAGAELLPHVRELVAAEDRLLAMSRELAVRPAPTTLRLLVSEDGTGPLLIALMHRVRAELSGVRVEIAQIPISEQSTALANGGSLDALIERTPAPVPVGPGTRTALREEPLCVVVPDGAEVPELLTVGQLDDVELRDMSWLPEPWLDWFPPLRQPDRRDETSTGVMIVSSFRQAIQSVPVDGRPCIAPISIASNMTDLGCRIVPILDAPIATLDLVTVDDHEHLQVLHRLAADLGAPVPTAPTDRVRRAT